MDMTVDYSACILKHYPSATLEDFTLEQTPPDEITLSHWNNAKLGDRPNFYILENVVWLEVLRERKLEQIKAELAEELNDGDSGYMTTGLGERNFRIDSSRGDLSNMQNLRDFANKKIDMDMGALGCDDATIAAYKQTYLLPIRGYDNTVQMMTLPELDIIIYELQAYGLWLYQHKWEVDQAVAQAKTAEQINAITFIDMEV